MLRYILTIVATIIIAYISIEFSDDDKLVWHQSSRREDNEKVNTNKHSLSPPPYCPSDDIRNHLNCTDWLNDALESMAIVMAHLLQTVIRMQQMLSYVNLL